MDERTRDLVTRCTRASDDGSQNFPQIVAALSEAGVERYHTDLERAEKTYYLPNGESHVVSAAHGARGVAREFSAQSVERAIRQSQAGAITYAQFCDAVMDAGCVAYLVSIVGRRVVYYGRTGEAHVEPFPSVR